MSALPSGEAVELARHELTIATGLQTFYEVGEALLAIRDSRLYRADHATFEDYCRDRWGMSRMRASQLIAASAAFAAVNHGLQPPENERQLRPIARLPTPELQREAWGIAVEMAAEHTPNGRPTALLVEAAVAHVRDPDALQLAPIYAARAADKLAVHYSSATPEWCTPPQIVAAVLDFFDEIDLDPCAEAGEPKTVPALRHYTIADDGLAKPWSGRTYMNPPYGDAIPPWIAKLDACYRLGAIEAGIALVPARTDTAWFEPLWAHTICFVRGRLKFGGSADSAPFPSALVYLGTEPGRFARAFAHLGNVVEAFRDDEERRRP